MNKSMPRFVEWFIKVFGDHPLALSGLVGFLGFVFVKPVLGSRSISNGSGSKFHAKVTY